MAATCAGRYRNALAYNAQVVTFRRLIVVAIFVVAIACPIVELFDHWDHTLQDGNDIEGTFVVVALCAAVALVAAAVRKERMRPLVPIADSVVARSAVRCPDRTVRFVFLDSSPPILLRI